VPSSEPGPAIALISAFALAFSACAFNVCSLASANLIWDSSLSWTACFATIVLGGHNFSPLFRWLIGCRLRGQSALNVDFG
jgi:hypothetical protein